MSKEDKKEFNAILIIAEQPTVPTGEIYTKKILYKLLERFSKKPGIIVQELNPVERKVKNISLAEVWDKKIMADVVGGEILDNHLIINCVTRANRDGRKLKGIIETNGLDSLEFFPVGYGTQQANGIINDDYELTYVAVEPKGLK